MESSAHDSQEGSGQNRKVTSCVFSTLQLSNLTDENHNSSRNSSSTMPSSPPFDGLLKNFKLEFLDDDQTTDRGNLGNNHNQFVLDI